MRQTNKIGTYVTRASEREIQLGYFVLPVRSKQATTPLWYVTNIHLPNKCHLGKHIIFDNIHVSFIQVGKNSSTHKTPKPLAPANSNSKINDAGIVMWSEKFFTR